jgi:hypothetical protein
MRDGLVCRHRLPVARDRGAPVEQDDLLGPAEHEAAGCQRHRAGALPVRCHGNGGALANGDHVVRLVVVEPDAAALHAIACELHGAGYPHDPFGLAERRAIGGDDHAVGGFQADPGGQLHGRLVLACLSLAALDGVRASAALRDDRDAHHPGGAARVGEQPLVAEIEVFPLALDAQGRSALRLDDRRRIGAWHRRLGLRRLAARHRHADDDREGHRDRGEDEARETLPLHGWAARMSASVSST